MFTYNEKRPRGEGVVTIRWNGFHLEILNPSKNGVFRSPTYQVKSFWKIPHPERNTSRTAFNLDLVVGVSQPHELRMMSPLGSISAMRLPWSLTDVNPSESTLTEVLDFDQLVRVAIAACICCSILRMGEIRDYPYIITTDQPHLGKLVTNWNNLKKSQPDRFDKKRTVLETVQKIVHVIQVFLIRPVEPIRGNPLLVSLGRLSDFSFWVTLV